MWSALNSAAEEEWGAGEIDSLLAGRLYLRATTNSATSDWRRQLGAIKAPIGRSGLVSFFLAPSPSHRLASSLPGTRPVYPCAHYLYCK